MFISYDSKMKKTKQNKTKQNKTKQQQHSIRYTIKWQVDC